MRRALWIAAIISAFGASAASAQVADTIRGRVVTESGRPVSTATIRVTPVGSTATRDASSDSTGAFSLVLPAASGGYVIAVTAVGFATQQRRVALDSTATSRQIEIEFRLQENVQRLDAVRVQAGRERPRENDSRAIGTGTMNPQMSELSAASGNLSGDIAASLGTLAGVTALPGGGFSVLGMDPSANNVTMGGMLFTGAQLPRDLQAAMTVATTSADASQSGFAGAGVSINPYYFGGWNFTVRGTLDHPALQFTPIARGVTNPFLNTIASGVVTRSLSPTLRLNVFWQGERQVTDAVPMARANDATVRGVGLSPDSLQRVLAIGNALGIVDARASVDQHIRNAGSALVTLSYSPSQVTTLTTILNTSLDRTASAGSPLAAGSRGLSDRRGSIWLNTSLSRYVGPTLNIARVMVSRDERSSSPYSSSPAADVRIASDIGSELPVFTTVGLGGAAVAGTRSKNWDIQLRDDLMWITIDRKHRFTISGNALLEGYAIDSSTDTTGRFWYASLADFENNHPSSYIRTLSPPTRGGRVATLQGSITDSWRSGVGQFALRMNVGASLDATRFLDRPAFSQQVSDAFGVRTDARPSSFSVSPRFGITVRRGQTPDELKTSTLDPFVRSEFFASIGEYRGRLAAGALDPAYSSAFGSSLEIECVGPSTPTPDWSQLHVPTDCVGGTSGDPFANRAKGITVFSPDYSPTRSRRASVGWSGKLTSQFIERFEATYTNAVALSSARDLNFRNAPRFSLDNEGNRPVFADRSAIDPASGLVSSSGSRVNSAFSNVFERVSDLQSHTLQLQAQASRYIGDRGSSLLRASYTFLLGRGQQRGFSGSTSGDPSVVEWGPLSASGRHEFNLTAQTVTFNNRVAFTAVGRVASAPRFTPLVSGDINGDGLANDRAFIFDPATAADPDVAAGMQSIIDGGPGKAATCLKDQLRTIAKAFSCRGGWYSTLNLSAVLEPRRLNVPSRAKFGVTLINALAAADVLVHGSRGARGWGQYPQADPTLLTVHGFDPGQNRYEYSVNPFFGTNRARAARSWAPFRLALEVSLDLGTDESRGYVMRLLLAPGSDASKPSHATDSVIVSKLISLPAALTTSGIARFSSALRLEASQRERMERIVQRTLGREREIFTPVARYLATIPVDAVDTQDVLRRIRDAMVFSAENHASAIEELVTVLSKEQLSRISPMDRRWFDPDDVRGWRAAYPGLIKLM